MTRPVLARRVVAFILVVVASLAVFAAVTTGYASYTLFDADEFAERAVATLDDDAVKSFAGREVTEQVVLRANRDLIAIQPLIQSAASSIVGNNAFRGLFRTAARDAHRTIFKGDRDTIVFKVSDVGVLLIGALRQFQPKLAERLPSGAEAELVEFSSEGSPLDLAKVTENVDQIYLLALGLMVGCWALAVLVSVNRRRTFVEIGIGIAVAGVLVVVAYSITRNIVLGRIGDPLSHDAAEAVWDAFLFDLRTWGWVLAAIGVVIAASAASLIRAVDVDVPLARAWRAIVTTPERPWLRVVRALALVTFGVLLVVRVWEVLQFALLALSIYIIYQGVSDLLGLIARPRERDVAEEVGERAGRVIGFFHRLNPGVVAAGVGVIAVAVLVLALLGGGGTSSSEAAEIDACNGAEELCDKPVNEVVFPGSHNAMSAATNRGYLFPQHERGIPEQLNDGIRALLIDSYYGQKADNGRVKTELDSSPKARALVDEFGEEFVNAALRVRDNLGFSGNPKREKWLCHGFCELGALSMQDTFRQVRDFLVRNPNEVLVIVIEDSVTPKDTAKAIKDSGLYDYVYRRKPGPPWPTLRELIESGERVLVVQERNARGVPWLHQAYELMQETPYKFTSPAQLANTRASCQPNRGPLSASLFLLNNWIDTSPAPRPSKAKRANSYDNLLKRAEECQKARNRLPNIIAVDFYKTGDLFKVTRKLNGLE